MHKILSLETAVGERTYTTWVKMLRSLVPQGRTHLIAPLVAGMLQYAVNVVPQKHGLGSEANSVEHLLVSASECGNVKEASEHIGEPLKQLFDDAGVRSERVSSAGEEYSIADRALYEFINWYAMPWEV